MTAYLTLRAGSDLTISDIAAWLDRARTLGADDTTPVRLGAPPSVGATAPSLRATDGPARELPSVPADDHPPVAEPEPPDDPTLTVQVSVRRTILPPAASRAKDNAAAV